MIDNLENATVVDVRTPAEFQDEHYPGAINIPVDQVVNRLDEFKKMKTPIVAYCRSGARSALAVSLLRQNGINDAMNGGSIYDILHQTNS